ncbi:hypothetical protein SAMN05216207_10912 [Pseudonocardia ammonioxydans]|uniref:Uncharacterized protein n=1 Tax=Pseudonocardia ammonioxydans TaxID=260086 RepID=A0A1I5I9H7_PSUAM|nr:hypothetical protein SAMN05216207_10912 [Pseudonocardia ammonioxydans]
MRDRDHSRDLDRRGPQLAHGRGKRSRPQRYTAMPTRLGAQRPRTWTVAAVHHRAPLLRPSRRTRAIGDRKRRLSGRPDGLSASRLRSHRVRSPILRPFEASPGAVPRGHRRMRQRVEKLHAGDMRASSRGAAKFWDTRRYVPPCRHRPQREDLERNTVMEWSASTCATSSADLAARTPQVVTSSVVSLGRKRSPARWSATAAAPTGRSVNAVYSPSRGGLEPEPSGRVVVPDGAFVDVAAHRGSRAPAAVTHQRHLRRAAGIGGGGEPAAQRVPRPVPTEPGRGCAVGHDSSDGTRGERPRLPHRSTRTNATASPAG